jgi:cytosine/adenosine deaminase-related metal-dependent hydrolase
MADVCDEKHLDYHIGHLHSFQGGFSLENKGGRQSLFSPTLLDTHTHLSQMA